MSSNSNETGNVVGGSVLAGLVGFIVAGPVGAAVAAAAVPVTNKVVNEAAKNYSRDD